MHSNLWELFVNKVFLTQGRLNESKSHITHTIQGMKHTCLG
jgi:hypothetical protein